jgi:hypothetical protein
MIVMTRLSAMAATAVLAAGAALVLPVTAGHAAPSALAQPYVLDRAATTADISLFGVSCGTATSCLAVGQESTASNVGSDFAQAWNGRIWRVVTPPSPGSPDALNGVACTATMSCIAVGSYASAAGPDRALAVAWDSRKWRVLRIPSPGNSELNGISCPQPDRCVAVGDFLTIGARHTLAEAWNGKTWRILSGPATHSSDSVLGSISCSTANICLAVGEKRIDTAVPATEVSLTETWNGTRWTIVSSPSPGTSVNDLTGVSCPGHTTCVAAGWLLNGRSPSSKPLAMRWDGSKWRLLHPLSAGPVTALDGISCAHPAECMAIGADLGKARTHGLLAESWNGTTWRMLPTAAHVPAEANLLAISCPRPGRCVAVGDYLGSTGSMRALAEEWTGAKWILINQTGA